jgi:hypothetical protein
MYDLFTGNPDDQQARVAWLMQLFQHARNQRVNFEVQWEESSALMWPEYRNSFSFGHVRAPGVKYTQYQVDSSGGVKAGRFMAVADALISPMNMLWSKMAPVNPELLKDYDARLYYDKITKIMWAERYAAHANFQTQQQTGWLGMGVFGNHGMMVETYDGRPGDIRTRGLRYLGQGPGEIYVLQNHQGRVDGFIRHFRWTARQAYQKWGDKIPPFLGAALERADVYTLFDFLQFVIPRTDYDPRQVFTARGKPWCSLYVSVIGYNVIEEGGYYSLPLAHGRYTQAPEEWYGRGPAQQVLPELKTKNAAKEAYMKQAKLAGDPAYLMPEDGMFDFKTESGSFNYGAMSEDGKKLVDILPTGQIAITKEFMEDCDKNIDAAFLVDLFPLLFDKKGAQRSARETVEVANQMGIFLAPTLGRQFGEYLATMITREYDCLNRMRKFPAPPPSVKEAGAEGGLRAIFCGPLARALNSQGIAGFMRSVEMTAQIAQSSEDDSVWDVYDFPTAIPEMATEMYVPARWMASPKKIAAKAQTRAKAQAQQAQLAALPGQAAIMKAQAISDKAQTGGNIGGTLSGTAPGQNPQVPGNPAGTTGQPGTFGMPGQPGQPGQ